MRVKSAMKTNNFEVKYIESEVEHPILWESHCHAQYEMIAVADGDITVMLEGESYRLQKNGILIIPPLFYHSVTVNGNGSYRRITALFDPDAIPEALQNAFAGHGRSVTVASHRIEELQEVCLAADQEFYAPLLQALMIRTLYDALQTPQSTNGVERDEFLQRTFEYIDAHLHEKILLDDLSQYTLRSKSSFCHLFEERMHVSPKQYILQKKLALAAKLINEGTPPTVAATRVGYENYSNFYRLYLKKFQETPKKDLVP